MLPHLVLELLVYVGGECIEVVLETGSCNDLVAALDDGLLMEEFLEALHAHFHVRYFITGLLVLGLKVEEICNTISPSWRGPVWVAAVDNILHDLVRIVVWRGISLLSHGFRRAAVVHLTIKIYINKNK